MSDRRRQAHRCEDMTKEGLPCPANARRRPDPDGRHRCLQHTIEPSVPGALDVEELRVLARRQKDTEAKRRQRARRAEEQAKAAIAPNPDGFQVPPMPSGLAAIRKWVRQAHDAYSHRKISPLELTEVRRSASSVGDLYRTGAEIRKAEAAIRAAEAQERMAEVLASVEHGGAAVMLLTRLQESLTDGRRRPLPGRVHQLTPPPAEPAS